MNVRTESVGPRDRGPLTWRTALAEDLLELEKAFKDPASLQGVATHFVDPDAAGDPWLGIVGVDQEGRVAAATVLTFADEERGHCVSRSFVVPSMQKKSTWKDALSWQMSAARELAQSATPGRRGQLEIHVHPGQGGLEALLRAKGFSWLNSTIELSRELSDLPEPPSLGSYFALEQWQDHHGDQGRRLLNQLLAKGDGPAKVTRKEWEERCVSVSPAWSYALIDKHGDRPSLQGFLLAGNRGDSDDSAPTGSIEMLAVADGAGNSAAFQTLAVATMRAQHADSVKRTVVTVDEPGDPLTTRLYEDLGFARSYEIRSYTTGL